MKEKLILLVEDNHEDEMLTLRLLTQANVIHQTMVVSDGQEALDYLFYKNSFSDRLVGIPQIILLDFTLPKIDGPEVLRKIRSTKSTMHIPVIILTSSQEEKNIASRYVDGGNLCLVKPVDIKNFSEAIQHFLFYWGRLTKGLE